jgi:hypothetical protein
MLAKTVKAKTNKRFPKGLYRTYQGGLSTKGWTKGTRIMEPKRLMPGDVLIQIVHKQQKENLIQIKKITANLFHYVYVRPTLSEPKGQELKAGDLVDLNVNEYYLAESNAKIAA